MATPITKIEIDPKGDILLHFPGVSVPHQLNGLGDTSRGKQPDIPALLEPWHSPGTASLCSHVETQSLGASPGPSNRGYAPGPVAGPSGGMRTPGERLLELQPAAPEQHPITLRVSSSVLCLVSPVFSAMLNGPMAEGQAFRAPNSPRPFPITLHEDDGQIFSILANVVHHRADDIPFLPTTSTLVALAAIVDKYACGPAVMPYGVLWVQRAAERREDPEYAGLLGRCNLLLFSYVIDLPEQFAGLSWDVLLMHRQTLKDETEFGLELPISPDHELLRHDLHGRSIYSRTLSQELTPTRRNIPPQGPPPPRSPRIPDAARPAGNQPTQLPLQLLAPRLGPPAARDPSHLSQCRPRHRKLHGAVGLLQPLPVAPAVRDGFLQRHHQPCAGGRQAGTG